jgi:type VI secretion system secreted protein Hcp
MDLILLKPGDANLAGNDCVDIGVEGSNRDSIAGCIKMVSMHFGVKQQITTDVSNSARTSGRPIVNEISLVKYFDKSSLMLYKACLTAKPIGVGDNISRIFVLRNGIENDDKSIVANIFTIELTNAMVSAIETQSSPEDMTTDKFTLNFTDIKWIYGSQESNDITQSNIEFAWSVARNRPF